MCVSVMVYIPFLTALSALYQAQVASLTCKFTSICVCDLKALNPALQNS